LVTRVSDVITFGRSENGPYVPETSFKNSEGPRLICKWREENRIIKLHVLPKHHKNAFMPPVLSQMSFSIGRKVIDHDDQPQGPGWDNGI